MPVESRKTPRRENLDGRCGTAGTEARGGGAHGGRRKAAREQTGAGSGTSDDEMFNSESPGGAFDKWFEVKISGGTLDIKLIRELMENDTYREILLSGQNRQQRAEWSEHQPGISRGVSLAVISDLKRIGERKHLRSAL